MGQETNLYRNRSKTVKLLAMSGGICVILLLTFLYCIGLFDGELKVKPAVFSGGALLVMLILLLSSLLNLRDKSAQIVLNESYFSGKTTPLAKAFGAGNWEDVTAINLQKVGGDTLVIVTFKNASNYKDRLPSMLWKMAYDEASQQVNIMYSASVIAIEPNELYDLFISYWKHSKKGIGDTLKCSN
ncbi:MAG: hypothetical protein K0S24_3617 [Sphingobacterium sp.]|jgi:hypothetical protein|nr:hypothetical protein [Sphingobacterium sp.]